MASKFPDQVTVGVRSPTPELNNSDMGNLRFRSSPNNNPSIYINGAGTTSQRSFKRSSSTSNDLLYERDRFRARFNTLNGNVCLESCEVCDIVGGKTAKLSSHEGEMENETDPVNLSDTLVEREASSRYGLSSLDVLDSQTNDTIEVSQNAECNCSNSQISADFLSTQCSPLHPESSFFNNLEKSYDDSDINIPIKFINQEQLEMIFDYYFNQPLPSTSQMFPWLHGLHKENFAQKQFFVFQKQQQTGYLAPYSTFTEKPTSARFIMIVDDRNIDEHRIFRNSVNCSEILKPIDVSRVEMRNIVESLVKRISSEEADVVKLTELLVNDCLVVKHFPLFLNLDPENGVSLRNFHIQVAKSAVISDFIVPESEKADSLVRVLWLAQQNEAYLNHHNSPYNTFKLKGEFDILNDKLFTVKSSSSFSPVFTAHHKTTHPLNISTDTAILSSLNYWDNDFQLKERLETTSMSRASKIFRNVWVGNIWDANAEVNTESNEHFKTVYFDPSSSIVVSQPRLPTKSHIRFSLLVYCHENSTFPDVSNLSSLLFLTSISSSNDRHTNSINLDFPPSGSVGLGNCKVDNFVSIVNVCKLLYLHSSSSGITPASLIYCSDGFTESSLLVLCYLIYSLAIPLDEALLLLHLEYKRPFYVFNSDIQFLRKMQSLLISKSPKKLGSSIKWGELEQITSEEVSNILLSSNSSKLQAQLRLGYIDNDSDSSDSSDDESESEAQWVEEVEGSLPSRILPYFYLGSLKHANNHTLLNKLSIKHIISVGESLTWLHSTKFLSAHDITLTGNENMEIYTISPKSDNDRKHSIKRVMKIKNLQDDGIDELLSNLPSILEFIDEVYKEDPLDNVLVHCRVGVSRSATVAIAEVMRRLDVNLPQAYLYVRVRRLNIVIQPNLRFMYELLKWEEKVKKAKGQTLRQIDWFVICREITRLNLPYMNS